MQFTVSAVSSDVREWQSQNGAMLTYKLKGNFPEKPEEMVQINTVKSKPKVPYAGEVIECEVSKDDPAFGKTIKRSQVAPGGGFGAPAGNSSSPKASSYDAHYEQTQESIQRQNALTNATNFVIALGQLLYSADKVDDAISAMSPLYIAEVHEMFVELNRPSPTVEQAAKEVFSDKQEPLPTIDEAF